MYLAAIHNDHVSAEAKEHAQHKVEVRTLHVLKISCEILQPELDLRSLTSASARQSYVA